MEKKLSPKQLEMLEIQYQKCLDGEDDSGNARGEHWILLHLINQFGLSASGPAEAMRISERIIYG